MKIKWTNILKVDVCDNFDDEMIHSRQRVSFASILAMSTP